MAGCTGGTSQKVCVDQAGNRTDESQCAKEENAPGLYRWYYLNEGVQTPQMGERVSGGSFDATPGVHYLSPDLYKSKMKRDAKRAKKNAERSAAH